MKKLQSGAGFSAILVVIIGIGLLAGCGETATDTATESKEPKFVVDQSKEKQAERMRLIERLSEDDVFPKITFADNGALIWVGSGFNDLDDATKTQYVKEIHSYAYRSEKGLFLARLKDIKTGMPLGEYFPETGLQLK